MDFRIQGVKIIRAAWVCVFYQDVSMSVHIYFKSHTFKITRTSARYACLVLAPAGGLKKNIKNNSFFSSIFHHHGGGGAT